METNKYEFILEYIYNNEELEKVFIFKLASEWKNFTRGCKCTKNLMLWSRLCNEALISVILKCEEYQNKEFGFVSTDNWKKLIYIASIVA